MISLCMIVKDESRCIQRCLTSAAPFVGEMIVCDTGSQDETVDIAERMGAKVVHAKWESNFSLPRNISLEQARFPWILILDADEWIEDPVWVHLEEILQSEQAVYELPILNYTQERSERSLVQHFAPRIFPKANAHFQGVIHEQIISPWPRKSLPEFYIHHDGYSPDQMKQRHKIARNLPLLYAELQRTPMEPFAHYNLAVTLMAIGDNSGAHQHFNQVLELSSDLTPKPSFVLASYIYTTGLLLRMGDISRAHTLSDQCLELCRDNPDFWINRGAILTSLGKYSEAIEAYTEAWEVGQKPFATCGIHNSESIIFRPFKGIEQVYRMVGDHARAELFKEALN